MCPDKSALQTKGHPIAEVTVANKTFKERHFTSLLSVKYLDAVYNMGELPPRNASQTEESDDDDVQWACENDKPTEV